MELDQIIARIRAERLSRGIKQATIAERMGCSSSYVQAIEYRRDVDRRWSTVMAYAEAVGVQVHVEIIPATPAEQQ